MSYYRMISLDEQDMSTLPLHETSPAAAPDTKQDSRRYRRSGGGAAGRAGAAQAAAKSPAPPGAFASGSAGSSVAPDGRHG